MKLRPSKADRAALNTLKEATGHPTYTKAIMSAVYHFPVMQSEIMELKAELRKAHDENRILVDAAGFLLDGLEVMKRVRSEQEE